jgi:hypothetical protein
MNESFKILYLRGDVLILDRSLKEKGFDVKMPAFVMDGESQLIWEQVNELHFVTKVRYALELINRLPQTAFPALRQGMVQPCHQVRIVRLYEIIIFNLF